MLKGYRTVIVGSLVGFLQLLHAFGFMAEISEDHIASVVDAWEVFWGVSIPVITLVVRSVTDSVAPWMRGQK